MSPGHGKAPVTGPLWELPACLLLDTVLLQGEGTGPTQRNKGRASLVRVDFSSFPPTHPPTLLCEFLNELNVPQEKVFLKFGVSSTITSSQVATKLTVGLRASKGREETQ